METTDKSEAARLIEIAVELVDFCGARSTRHWARGHKLILRDGCETYSNSPEFYRILADSYCEKYEKRPRLGTVRYAIGRLNRVRFQKRVFS